MDDLENSRTNTHVEVPQNQCATDGRKNPHRLYRRDPVLLPRYGTMKVF